MSLVLLVTLSLFIDIKQICEDNKLFCIHFLVTTRSGGWEYSEYSEKRQRGVSQTENSQHGNTERREERPAGPLKSDLFTDPENNFASSAELKEKGDHMKVCIENSEAHTPIIPQMS